MTYVNLDTCKDILYVRIYMATIRNFIINLVYGELFRRKVYLKQ